MPFKEEKLSGRCENETTDRAFDLFHNQLIILSDFQANIHHLQLFKCVDVMVSLLYVIVNSTPLCSRC